MQDSCNTETYYSNCLIEALRAKYKDPKNVKVGIYWKPWTRKKFWGFHAWWKVGDTDTEYHFVSIDTITWLNYWWHKGQIKSCDNN